MIFVTQQGFIVEINYFISCKMKAQRCM